MNVAMFAWTMATLLTRASALAVEPSILPLAVDKDIIDRNNKTDSRVFSRKPCETLLIAYAITGKACPDNFWIGVALREDTSVFFLSWETPCSVDGYQGFHVVPPPSSEDQSWARNRNTLYNHIMENEARRGCDYLYHVYADEDAHVQMTPIRGRATHGNAITTLHRLLLKHQPLAAVGRYGVGWQSRIFIDEHPRAVLRFDALFNAFSPRYRQVMLPYDTAFDSTSWGASNAVRNFEAEAVFPNATMEFQQLRLTNPAHAKYQRGRIGPQHYAHAMANLRRLFGMDCALHAPLKRRMTQPFPLHLSRPRLNTPFKIALHTGVCRRIRYSNK